MTSATWAAVAAPVDQHDLRIHTARRYSRSIVAINADAEGVLWARRISTSAWCQPNHRALDAPHANTLARRFFYAQSGRDPIWRWSARLTPFHEPGVNPPVSLQN
jgi:hypothetical protein